MVNGVIIVFLIPCAITDLKSKTIPIWWTVVFGISAMIYQIFWKKQKLEAILFSMIIGVTLLVAAKISNQRIGYGDGIIFLILGLWIGFWDGISLLFFSLILSSIISVYFIIVRRKGRDYRIPFIPFVTAAYIILEGLGFCQVENSL